MPTYDDLRKTQAEVELQTKLRSVETLHKSSNVASLKVEAAQQATPELPSQPPHPSAPAQEPEPQIAIAEPEPPQPWQVRKAADEQDLQTRKAAYAEAIKTNDFERKEEMEKELVERMKNFNYDAQDIKDFRSSVNHSYGAVSAYERMDRAVTEKERKEFIGEKQHELEKQHDWEQVQAKRAQIEAQKRGGERPASQTWQDGPTRPTIPPLPGQAPEAKAQLEKNQTRAEPAQSEPKKIQGNAEDRAPNCNADAERQARIAAYKQNPNSQAQFQAEDRGQNRNADAERQARIAAYKQNPNSQAQAQAAPKVEGQAEDRAQKRGEAVNQEKQDMPQPVPKPHIRR